MKKMLFWLECTRAYSLPMSIMAWVIPFSFGCFNGGNIFYGLLALAGIVCAHLGANLFDDIIDYKSFLKHKKTDNLINLKKGKCKYFLDESLKLSTAYKTCALLFFAAVVTGLFFIYIYKLPILIIMGVTGILCLIYPKSGYFGLSEIIIGLVFSPLLFTGVYYVMNSQFSKPLELLSFSFALVTITLLYTDFFLDYNTDKEDKKKTIPILCGSKQNAYYFYLFIIFLIYANIFIGIHAHVFSAKFSVIFISIIYALKTARNLQYYIDKEIKDEKEFIGVMNSVQKFIAVFSLLCVLSIFLH